MHWKSVFAVLLGLLAAGVAGYTWASPIGGVKISLLDSHGKALTDYGEIHYSVWTFDANGSYKVIERGTLRKWFIFSRNSIELSRDDVKLLGEICRKTGSKTAFLGVDVWVERNGRIYYLPPSSVELRPAGGFMAVKVSLRFDADDGIPLRPAGAETVPKTQGYINPPWVEWRTISDKSFQNVKIPILIINNTADSEVLGTAQIGASQSEYMGPTVTVVFGDGISKKASLDPGIHFKVLGRSFTNWYRGGSIITVPPGSWGYVWIEGTVHYIHQRAYLCERNYRDEVVCSPTGSERYFVKIDRFSEASKHGSVIFIKSGKTLGVPPVLPSSLYLERAGTILGSKGEDVYLSGFFNRTFRGGSGWSFTLGAPVGALVNLITGEVLPQWFNAIVVGFSVSGSADYAVMGEVVNNGPAGKVVLTAYRSRYTVSVPVKKSPWEIWKPNYVNTKVPVGLYVDVKNSG